MKKFIALLLCFIMVSSLFVSEVLAASVSLDSLIFTVCKDTENGLEGDVTAAVSGNNATLYLPGSAKCGNLVLSWFPAEGVTASDGKNTFESGTAPIPAPGGSIQYTVRSATVNRPVTFSTVQGSSGVPGLFLNVDENLGTIAAMNGDANHETLCYGTFFMDGKERAMSIKGRGNTTWSNYTKKPYNITVYADTTYVKKDGVKLIKDVKSKKWSILANAQDQTCLRNKLGFDLANALGIGLPSKNIDVWMNGEFLGNYLLTPKDDYYIPDEGYMVEIDNLDDVDQFTLPGSPNFTVKTMPDGCTVDQVKSTVSPAWTALIDSSSDEYLKYFDLDSWAKMYLLNEIYKDVDIVAGSIFFNKASFEDSDKLTAGPIWDLDGSLGRVSKSWGGIDGGVEGDVECTGGGWYIDSINGYTAFFRRLGEHESFMKRVYQIYNENKSVINGLLEDFETQSALVQASAEMNMARWPECVTDLTTDKYKRFRITSTTKTYGSGAYAVTYRKTTCWSDFAYNLKEYITKRLQFLSDTLTYTPSAVNLTVKKTSAPDETVTLTANSDKTPDSYKWQSSADGINWIDIAGATGKTYSATASDIDSLFIRCLAAFSSDTVISTKRVATVALSATASSVPMMPVPPKDHFHRFQSVVTQPTCTEFGYTTHRCTCGYGYVDSYNPALGHEFVNGKCTRCGASDPIGGSCLIDKDVPLQEGELQLILNKTNMGTFTFAKYDTGWTIKDGSGYLSVSSTGGLTHTTKLSDAVWSFSNSKFFKKTTRKTYYLKVSSKKLSVDTYDSNNIAAFHMYRKNETHTFTETVTAPTCTSGGYTTYTCACGAVYVGNYKNPVAHCYADGYCEVCNALWIHAGDCDCDGKTEADDLILLRKALFLIDEYNDFFDANNDGFFDVRDLIKLKKMLVTDAVLAE